MQAGRLRHRLTIQGPDSAETAGGEAELPYMNLVKVWGKVEPLGGDEAVVADQVQSEMTHNVEIRYIPLPTSEEGAAWNHLRIYWEKYDRTFEIANTVDPLERRINLLLKCKELT